jgi:hypothetical protein
MMDSDLNQLEDGGCLDITRIKIGAELELLIQRYFDSGRPFPVGEHLENLGGKLTNIDERSISQ